MAYLLRPIPGLICLASAIRALAAEPAQQGDPSAESRGATALPGEARQDPGQAKLTPPPLPGTKTAADTFRELLAMTPAERTGALADRSEEQRRHLENGLREYETLPKQQREARLRQLDLKAHLTVLMKLAPTNRVQRLKLVPADILPEIEERLKEWDRLPAKFRQQVLDYDSTSSYFLRVRTTTPSRSPAGLPGGFDPKSAVPAEPAIAGDSLKQLFQLPSREQEKTLETLPAAERAEMEKTLQTFAKLSPEQRKICVDSFEKLGRMSKEQRNEFLKNAARWKAMSPRERETWQALVTILPPTSAMSTAPPLPGPLDSARAAVTASNAPVPPGGSK